MRFVAQKEIASFSSGSSVVWQSDRLFLVGDDQPYFLMLDSSLAVIDSVAYQRVLNSRIGKQAKIDLEACDFVNGQFLCLGSGSAMQRNKLMLYTPHSPRATLRESSLQQDLFAAAGLQVNVEGLALAGSHLLLANRGNLSHPFNHLGIADAVKLKPGAAAPIEFRYKKPPRLFAGISGLHYHAPADRLYFTASTEAAASAMEDGAIGDSYLGYIDNISAQLQQPVIYATALYNLSRFHSAFRGHKIESVTIRSHQGGRSFYLVSDNDDGRSTVFLLEAKE